jgi:phosphoglycerate dehydrogenase-like enzyme
VGAYHPPAVPTPRIAVGPVAPAWVTQAVEDGGGEVVGADDRPDALVWLDLRDADALRDALARAPSVRWVQLPAAGVEAAAARGLFDDGREWTSAKGTYGEPVAEHALTLALAGLRDLPRRVRATSWGRPGGATLYDADVTVLGGGGISQALIALLQPFRARVTVVRRQPGPVPGAARTVTQDRLHEVLPGARVVFLALALTPETTGIIGPTELGLMGGDAWLVNVARGRHVVTDALVAALRSGAIGGAALDVTDPEPLPDGHPLWGLPNVIITPHTADWPEIVEQLLARRIAANVARFAAGRPLEGRVDPHAGY